MPSCRLVARHGVRDGGYRELMVRHRQREKQPEEQCQHERSVRVVKTPRVLPAVANNNTRLVACVAGGEQFEGVSTSAFTADTKLSCT